MATFFQRLFNREKRSMTLKDADGWVNLYGGPTAAGVSVTAESALSHPAVLGACRMLAEVTASLPLLTYERTKQGRERAVNHPVYKLLHEQPNPQQTPFTFKESLVLHLLLYGNCYVAVDWDTSGRPAALWPVHPSRVQIETSGGGTVAYKVSSQSQTTTYAADELLHVPMLAIDGVVGRSPVQLAREAIGAALAAEEHAGAYFGNAARPSGVLKSPEALSAEAAARLKASWQAAYGRGKAGTAVLENGLEYEPIAANAQESQLIESRQFAMREIAAVLRIPAHLLDPTARGTYANVETQSLEFLTFSLQPFLTRLEEAFTLRLFTPAERQRYFVEFLTDGLLRADTRTRYAAYKTALDANWLTVDEVRDKENMPRIR